MKKIKFIFSIIITLLSTQAFSQIGLQFSYIKPSGELGYIFEPAFCPEFIYGFSAWDDEFKGSIKIGYYNLKPRQDTFTTYAYGYDNGYQLLPGYDVFTKYQVIPISFSFDYKFMETKIYPAFGADFGVYLINYEKEHSISGLIDESSSGGTFVAAILPRVGFTYEIDEFWFLSITFGKSFGIEENLTFQKHWKSSFNVCYYID